MTKKLITGLTFVILLVGIVTSAYADTAVKLVINGKELAADVLPEVVKGRVLVPIRVISEALGADVYWDDQEKTVTVESKEAESLKMQVQRLEQALLPKDPLSAANTWAEAVKMRNGAWQYALMSPELKEEKHQTLAENYWSTGVSSPWVESYKVAEKERINAATYLYQIDYTYTDSAQTKFITPEIIMVKKYDQGYLVTSVNQAPDIRGEIAKITAGNTGITLLVVDKTAKEPNDQASITITEDTKLCKGYTDELISPGDLKEGNIVEVVYTWPALMSYPIQVGAAVIRVMS